MKTPPGAVTAGPVVTIGSVVQLRSGGPGMTVENPVVDATRLANDLQCDCVWMTSDGFLQRARFDVAMLGPVGTVSEAKFNQILAVIDRTGLISDVEYGRWALCKIREIISGPGSDGPILEWGDEARPDCQPQIHIQNHYDASSLFAAMERPSDEDRG